MVKYVNAYDLIFNGVVCNTLKEKPMDKYLVIKEDSRANCERRSSIFVNYSHRFIGCIKGTKKNPKRCKRNGFK